MRSPKYIKIGHTTMHLDRIDDDGHAVYYRENGCWELKAKWYGDRMKSQGNSMKHLNGSFLVRITKEEYNEGER